MTRSSVAVIGVVIGLWMRRVYPASIEWPALTAVLPLFLGEFGLKALYRVLSQLGFVVVKGFGAFDRQVFDAFAGGLARATLALVKASGRFDAQWIDAAVKDVGEGILALGQRVRGVQTGRIENYLLLVMVWGLGVIALAVLAVFIR